MLIIIERKATINPKGISGQPINRTRKKGGGNDKTEADHQ